MKMSHDKINLFILWTLALVLLSLPFLHILFDSGRVLCYRDLLSTFLPSKYLWAKTVLDEGVIPTWNPYLFSGTPFFSDLKSAVLYPLNLVFLFFDQINFFHAFSWYIFLHFPIMVFGMYLFLKNSGRCRQASIVFALVYTLSGVVVSSINMCNLLAIQCILPFFANFVHNWTNQPSPFLSVKTLGLVVCLSLPIYSGIPEFSYFFSLYFFMCLLGRFDRRRLLSFLVIGGSTLILSMAQLLPGLENFMLSERGSGNISIHGVEKFISHPAGLIEFFLQLPFGNLVADNSYWADAFSDSVKKDPFFASYYIGSGLFLGILGYFFSFKREFFFNTVFAIILLILALGKNFFFDLNATFFNYFPLWKVFRNPEKFIIPFSFFLVFAQAIGWECVLDRLKDKRETILLIGSWLILCCLSFILVQWLVPIDGHNISKDSWRLFFLMCLLQALILIVLKYRPHLWYYRWYLLLLVFATDLGIHARSIIWDQPVILFESPFANEIRSDLLERSKYIISGAAFRYSSKELDPDLMFTYGQLDPVGISTLTRTNKLFQGVSVLYGIHDIYGQGTLYNAEIIRRWKKLVRIDTPKTFNILGAYYLGVSRKVDDKFEMKIIKNKAAVPYVFIPKEIQHIADSINIVALLTSKDFNEQEQVLMESGKSIRTENNRVKSIEILRKDSSSIQIRVKPEHPGETTYLVLNESMDRHWRAYINDEPTPIYRTNGWSMSINLKQKCGASCLIEFRYENIWIKWGALITLSFVLISLSLFVFRKCCPSSIEGPKASPY